jgi:hypothetical protein
MVEEKPRPNTRPNLSYYELPYLYSNWLTLPRKLVLAPLRRVIGRIRHMFGVKALLLLGLAYVTDHVGLLQWVPASEAMGIFTTLSLRYAKYLLVAHSLKRALGVMFGWHQPELTHIKIRWRARAK